MGGTEMFTRENILYHAKKAQAPQELEKQLEQYLAFVEETPELLYALKQRYETLFCNPNPIFPIRSVGDMTPPGISESVYPGLFDTTIYLAAAGHFSDYVARNGIDTPQLDLVDTYYKNLRRFMQMNYVRDNTYALVRHGYFLYGYALPFSLRIGRLAYELRLYSSSKYSVCEDSSGNRTFVKAGEEISSHLTSIIASGEPYVTIHIPGEGRLDEQAVAQSLEIAPPILRKVFEKYHPRYIMCDSWLLSPQLREFIRPTSNIAKFQNMFDIIRGDAQANAIYDNIFKIPLCPIEEIVPQNDFQKSILRICKRDGAIYNGIGILKKEYCKL